MNNSAHFSNNAPYLPQDHSGLTRVEALFNHLVFALKYEGVDLLLFSKLHGKLTNTELLELLQVSEMILFKEHRLSCC